VHALLTSLAGGYIRNHVRLPVGCVAAPEGAQKLVDVCKGTRAVGKNQGLGKHQGLGKQNHGPAFISYPRQTRPVRKKEENLELIVVHVTRW
jgi:hypothetical protein